MKLNTLILKWSIYLCYYREKSLLLTCRAVTQRPLLHGHLKFVCKNIEQVLLLVCVCVFIYFSTTALLTRLA